MITSVGLDHTDLLGETLAQIARDKAGIITPGGRVIAGALGPEAREEVERAARERGAEIFSPPGAAAVSPDETGCDFDLVFPGGEVWAGVRAPMAGPHQAENAALAAGACRLLGLEEGDIRAGIGASRLPCRAERIAPGVVLDGAHNRDKARALVAALGEYPAGRRLLFWVRPGTRIIPASPGRSPGRAMGFM